MREQAHRNKNRRINRAQAVTTIRAFWPEACTITMDD